MTVQLESGLTPTDIQLSCVSATFTRNSFTDTEDDRGQAFLFERFNNPATFIEVIHTLPGKIRGNHVHQNCDETLNVVKGEMTLYLLCNCPKKHVFKQTMKSGDTVVTPKGLAHALQAIKETEIVVLFDQDPRADRDRVQILTF